MVLSVWSARTAAFPKIKELLEVVFSVRSTLSLYNEGQLPLRKSLEMAVRRVGGWCDMAASLRGHESRSRGTSTVGRCYEGLQ
jgi:hypothetical protein